MNIKYLKQNDGSKLFSFHRHDYHVGENSTFIDDGFNEELGEDTIENLIGDIREQFIWGANYEKDGKTIREKTVYNHLKDLDTDHIINILVFFTKKLEKSNKNYQNQWKAYHLIFLYELKYRYEKKIF